MSSLLAWRRGSSASLFDRIRGQEDVASELECLIESVKRQLLQVLNTRPGSCCSAPELGVMDFNDATEGTADIQGRIREAIRHCIRRYEPRIVRVEVCSPPSADSPLEMAFQVTAHVRLETLEQVTSFNIHMDSHRHYRMV